MKILVLGRGYVGTFVAKHLATCYDVMLVSKTEVDYTNRVILSKLIRKNTLYDLLVRFKPVN